MKAVPITVYLPDTRGVEISRYGMGNRKIGMGVFTYSRPAGAENTCPGATIECEAICYAKRIAGPVVEVYARNMGSDVPPIPDECQVLRIHVSGDFDSIEYIDNWISRLLERPDVTCWAYTRSWRVPELLPNLEALRNLPNVQLFASMDPSCQDVPPAGWRRAWIYRDFDSAVKGDWPIEVRLADIVVNMNLEKESLFRNMATVHEEPSTPAYVCPEETGGKQNCLQCGYCFEGKKHDVVFIEHLGAK